MPQLTAKCSGEEKMLVERLAASLGLSVQGLIRQRLDLPLLGEPGYKKINWTNQFGRNSSKSKSTHGDQK